jgi:hypothetical protein
MNFEIHFPDHRDAQYFLGTAGLDTDDFYEVWEKAILSRKPILPAKISCRYFLSEEPVNARVTVFTFSPAAHLKIEVDDETVGKSIREHLSPRSLEKIRRENKAFWAQAQDILKRENFSLEDYDRGATMPRSAIELLMKLCEQAVWYQQGTVHRFFTAHAIAKTDRLFVARWLVKLFETDRDPDSQLGVRIWELATPQIADDLIRLIQNPRHGENRGILCLALAKTKHPCAAEVVASALGRKGMTRWALEALGKLKASAHADTVRKFLNDSDGDIRREAKRTLKKMGLPAEIPPAAVHLVKNRRLLPKGLEEWSSNLDIEDLEPTLKTLSECVEKGFGVLEIAEVVAVVDDMKPEQTKAFCFPVSTNGQSGEVWLVIFMDDVDAPDLEIHGSAGLIRQLEEALPACG